jgi:hypothetical protein
MRDYRINTDRLVNQLVPHYLGGRRIILFLQSLLQPLNTLNKTWKEWADEKRIEAALTSQVIMLEYFLNRKFKKYLTDTSQPIIISDGEVNGTPMYWQSANSVDDVVLYNASEKKDTQTFRWKDEKLVSSDVSFIVSCPAVNTEIISETELTAMISYYVEKYRIAGKTFKVIYS